MSGGVAFVLDEAQRFETLCNMDMVGLEPVKSEEDIELLHGMVERHLEWSGSDRARRLLDDWDEVLPNFLKVMPHDLKRILRERQDAALEVAS
jgi:glutamate synthase (NADPH) large chain